MWLIAERTEGEALIKDIYKVIDGHFPALAAWALVSVLATLIGSCAANPMAQAKSLGRQLVETLNRPPESRLNYAAQSF